MLAIFFYLFPVHFLFKFKTKIYIYFLNPSRRVYYIFSGPRTGLFSVKFVKNSSH